MLWKERGGEEGHDNNVEVEERDEGRKRRQKLCENIIMHEGKGKNM